MNVSILDYCWGCGEPILEYEEIVWEPDEDDEDEYAWHVECAPGPGIDYEA